MQKSVKPVLRCAIYTRKSTEHNLDLEFNSLDAQREACEAYIKSQAHEGWRLVPTRYDDGAFSGASLDRPALQQLLAEVCARKVDIVVVYKVDRLTRSLADFAKLVELFDQHAVSFVSVTQAFNTTTSMGRLTLNVLLSFAQFEREVIGERVRDKIAASKKRGLWVGGPVPLGYASRDKKLVVVPAEAATVRLIFQRYLDLGSVGALAQDLDRQGIRTKRQVLSDGRVRGGCRFAVGALAYLLRNRIYVGEICHRGVTHPGEHEPILDRALFEAVQDKLTGNAVTRETRLKASAAILAGVLFDDRGNRMSASHANKRGVRYRYYVSQALLQRRPKEAGSVARVSAPDLERQVMVALKQRLQLVRASEGDSCADDNQRIRSEPLSDRQLIERYVDSVILKTATIELVLREAAVIEETEHSNSEVSPEATDNDLVGDTRRTSPVSITLAWNARTFIATKGVLHAPESIPSQQPISAETRVALLDAIAKARRWVRDLADGRVKSLAAISQAEGKGERYIHRLATLAFVAPRLLSAIVEGRAPASLTVTSLTKGMPDSWAEQERRWGL